MQTASYKSLRPAIRLHSRNVDVVFRADHPASNALQSLDSRYWSCKAGLADFIEYSRLFVNEFEAESKFIALGLPRGQASQDVWSLDTTGVLTLTVGKNTYERLGVVGDKLPWKGCNESYAIRLWPHKHVVPYDGPKFSNFHPSGPKQMAALRAWDEREGLWKIVYHLSEPGPNATLFPGSIEHSVEPKVRTMSDALAPEPASQLDHRGKEQEEWDEDVHALLEWVGMACLGAQRINANDKPDPYLSVYAPPYPCVVTNVVHIRWTGLLPPTFVQSILDLAANSNNGPPSFIAVTSHGVLTSPVAYIAPTSPMCAPVRATRMNSEDTWTLLVWTCSEEKEMARYDWVLAETIGQWDSRWG